MTELLLDGGEVRQRGRSRWTGRLRRPLVLVAVTLLCGVFYLAGIWTAMNSKITCSVTGPGTIVCGDDAGAPPQPLPARPPGSGQA